jgi:Holliday junction resolvase
MDIEKVVSRTPVYQGALTDAEAFVNDLLCEAVALKQWTIPFGAYVQIDIGEIKAVKLFEIGKYVACVLVDESGHYFLVWVDPYSQGVQFTHMLDIVSLAGVRDRLEFEGDIKTKLEQPQQYPGNVLPRLLMGIKILLAAIIRDFWVVEERQRVFGVAVKTKKAARLRSDWGKKSVVYIPRIRYVGDIQKRADELNYVTRRPHFVVGHLRKALQASERQIVLAREYGIVVPEGFTFVRPHRRGDKAQETIYRSRSALQCIRALKREHMETGSDAWFTYELNVKNWLSSHGFEVEHISSNRHGDGGVDIQAYKEGEHLLVQCKYWQTEKIGPKVIREILGTLQTYPKGARGVIVTSTELTEGARIKAIENGIQFIEKTDFSTKLTRRL